MRRAKLAALLCFLALPLFAQRQIPDPAKVGHTTGDFTTNAKKSPCPAIGDATLAGAQNPGRADPYLNALKNRDKPPAEADYQLTTISAILADEPSWAVAAGKRRRDKWTPEQRDSVDEQEKEAIEVVGFLARRPEKESEESCNCHSTDDVDYHMWIVEKEGVDRSQAMVVEMSPRLLKQHKEWPRLAGTAASTGTLIRVRGWRTWDQEHAEQLHRTRGTMWEIHPIHEIDIADEYGDWIPIDSADAKAILAAAKASIDED